MMTPEQRDEIDNMTQFEMCRRYRFAPIGDPIFLGERGEYFMKIFKEKGGFTPEISKKLGW